MPKREHSFDCSNETERDAIQRMSVTREKIASTGAFSARKLSCGESAVSTKQIRRGKDSLPKVREVGAFVDPGARKIESHQKEKQKK